MLLFWTTVSLASTFDGPLPVIAGNTARAVKADGTVVEGDPVVTPGGVGAVKKVTMKLADESKVKFAAADLAELYLVPNGYSRMASAANSMGSISEIARTSGARSLEATEVLFVAQQMPNGKTLLLQLLNPGFDATVGVYADPAGKETAGVSVGGVAMSGGVTKSFYVRPFGKTEVMLVKKGNYGDNWDEIFGACAGFAKADKPDWNQFADDVVRHASTCAPAAP